VNVVLAGTLNDSAVPPATVSVTLWVVSGAMPLLAVTLKGKFPSEVGVPVRKPLVALRWAQAGSPVPE
jgi:hypothetical protein